MRSREGTVGLRKELVRDLKMQGVIRKKNVEEAMLEVRREDFMPGSTPSAAYIDRPQSIGDGQTISAPHMVAIMAEELMAEPGMKVLEIGTGSGYHAALVSRLIAPGGRVYSIERFHSLATKARRNLDRAGIDNVTVVEGDGSMGLPSEAPYDRVYYTCAAPNVPDVVMEQVRTGGKILAVVGPKYGSQRLIRYTITDSGTEVEKLTHCVFVPLVGELGY